jgi:hypothetical protein
MHQTPVTASPSHPGIIRQITRSAKLIVLTGVVGALAGGVVSHFLHPKWVGRMTIQIGQISAPQGEGVVSRPIENQLSAADRYNLPGLRLQVLKDLGLPAPDDGPRESRLIFDTLQATPSRAPDLIKLQVSASSREQATTALMASFKTFSAPHQQLFGPALSGLKSDLDNASAKLAAAEQDYTRSYQSVQSSSSPNGGTGNDARSVLVASTATLINQQILELRQQKATLQEAVSPLLTYPTRVVEAPYVPIRPSTPGAPVLVAIGAVVGLLLGLAFSVRGSVARGWRPPSAL